MYVYTKLYTTWYVTLAGARNAGALQYLLCRFDADGH